MCVDVGKCGMRSAVNGKTILIIAGSTFGGVLALFIMSCVVYHKCYSPVKHSAHMHDELVESLLEDERNLLSGHHEDEHHERMAEARRVPKSMGGGGGGSAAMVGVKEIDPALDLKDNSAALKEPRPLSGRSDAERARMSLINEDDDDYDAFSQSETEDEEDYETKPRASPSSSSTLASSSSALAHFAPMLSKPSTHGPTAPAAHLLHPQPQREPSVSEFSSAPASPSPPLPVEALPLTPTMDTSNPSGKQSQDLPPAPPPSLAENSPSLPLHPSLPHHSLETNSETSDFDPRKP